MTIRTSKKTVTFTRPFVLGDFDEVQPAGAYSVETDEELLEGISFPAYRRILTLIRLHPKPGHPGLTQTLTIDPKELDAALERDRAPAAVPANPDTGFSSEPNAQRNRQVIDAGSFSGLEPHLGEAKSNPILRLVKRRDGLSETGIWGAVRTARGRLAARFDRARRIGTTEPRQEEADRQAVERADDDGMMVHPEQTFAPRRQQEVAS